MKKNKKNGCIFIFKFPLASLFGKRRAYFLVIFFTRVGPSPSVAIEMWLRLRLRLNVRYYAYRRGSWRPIGHMRPSSPLLDSVRDRFEAYDQLATDFMKNFLNTEENMATNAMLFDVVFLVGQSKQKTKFLGVRAILGVRSRYLSRTLSYIIIYREAKLKYLYALRSQGISRNAVRYIGRIRVASNARSRNLSSRCSNYTQSAETQE